MRLPVDFSAASRSLPAYCSCSISNPGANIFVAVIVYPVVGLGNLKEINALATRAFPELTECILALRVCTLRPVLDVMNVDAQEAIFSFVAFTDLMADPLPSACLRTDEYHSDARPFHFACPPT